MIENFPTPKADNDNRTVEERKAVVDVYNRIADFRNRLRKSTLSIEQKSELVQEIRKIHDQLFNFKISPDDALARVRELAEEKGVTGDL